MRGIYHAKLLGTFCGSKSHIILEERQHLCTPHCRKENKWTTSSEENSQSLEAVISSNSKYQGCLQRRKCVSPATGNVVGRGHSLATVSITGGWLSAGSRICIYRKHFCSFQIALASVDNYMLIITQHSNENKTDSTANTTAI